MRSLALVLALTASQTPPDPTFGASVENVFVDAFVTSGGEAVKGLGPDDFEIRDNGLVQRVTVVRAEEVPLHAVLVFDTSDSVAGDTLKDLVAAGQGFLAALRPQDHVTLLTFSHQLRLRSNPGEATLEVVKQLAGLEGHGATALYDAADAALTVASQEPHALILIFTDGVDTSSWLRPEEVLKAAEHSTSVVYAVSANPEGGQQLTFLKNITETTSGRILFVGSTHNLAGTFLKVLSDIRSRYLLGYEPTGSIRDGWHSIAIRLRTRKGDVRARRGYFRRAPAN